MIPDWFAVILLGVVSFFLMRTYVSFVEMQKTIIKLLEEQAIHRAEIDNIKETISEL